MARFAKGSESTLRFTEEVTFGTAPSTRYRSILFNTESLDETTNRVTSEDLSSDRTVPDLQAGNIASGGQFTADVKIADHIHFWRHFMTPTITQKCHVVDLAAMAALSGTAYIVGDLIKEAGDTVTNVWVCIVAGTATTGTFTSDFVGKEVASGGTTEWRCIGEGVDILDWTDGNYGASIARGVYVQAATGTNVYICTKGGSGLGTVGTLTHTIGRIADDGTGHTEIPEFEFVGAFALSGGSFEQNYIAEYTLVPGTDLSVISAPGVMTDAERLADGSPLELYDGLSFEKGIVGNLSANNLFVNFTAARVNGIDLAIPQEGPTKATFSISASESSKVGTSATQTTPGTVTKDEAVMGPDAFITIVDETGTIDTAVIMPFRECALSVTNNIDESVYVVGKRVREAVPEGTRVLTGTISMYFEQAADAYDAFKNDTKKEMHVSFTRQGMYQELYFPEIKLTGSGTPKISGQGVITADYEVSAYKNTATYDFQMVVRVPCGVATFNNAKTSLHAVDDSGTGFNFGIMDIATGT